MKWHRTPSRRAVGRSRRASHDDHRRCCLAKSLRSRSITVHQTESTPFSKLSSFHRSQSLSFSFSLFYSNVLCIRKNEDTRRVQLNQREYFQAYFLTRINYRHCAWITCIGPDSLRISAMRGSCLVPSSSRRVRTIILENILYFLHSHRLSHSLLGSIRLTRFFFRSRAIISGFD